MVWSTQGRPRYQWGWLGILLLAVSHMMATSAMAQFERSQISGVVKDDQGGVVPGVTVTAINKQTGASTSTVTDASGFYTVPNLLPGRYDVTAELQGFRKVTQSNIQLDAAAQVRADLTLSAGTVTEQVTVTAEPTPLQRDTALRKTVESKDIEQLAFSGRNPIGVAGLKAGVSGGSFNNYSFSDLGNGNFNINGSRADENTMTIDGTTAVRTRASGGAIGIQNVDTIQEVQVLTGDYLPEFGRASG
jgi:hypothetical protein